MSYESFLKNIDAIITPVLLIGLDGSIKMINRAFGEAAGLSSPAPHYVGRSADDLLGKDLVKSCVDLAQKVISQKGSIKNFAFARRNGNGEKIFWDVTVTQWLVDDMSDGVLLSFKEVGRDYSQSREHRFMDAIIDGARDALLIMTGDHRLKKVNQTFLDLLGGKAEDYLKHNLREFVFDFDRFVEETKNSTQGMPFHSVLRRQDHEPVNCETVARCYPASMFASSEQSGVSEVYWILELRALDEKENRIVEVISGKNRLLEDHLSNMKELNAHLHQQIAELSAKQKPEEDSQQEKDWAENLMAVSEELNTVRKAKQDAEMRLRVLQNKYNEEINALKNDKVGIITDYQVILQEKQALAEKLQALANVLAELREELAKLQQEHNDAKDAMIRLQDENLALKADNDNLVSANADLSADVAVLKMSYDDVSASAEASQHLQGFTDGLNNELDAKTRECENLSRSVLELEASLSESNDLLGMEKNNLIRQTESFQLRIERLEAQIERLEAENLALQEQHRLALEAQKNDLEQQHKLDLNTVASTQQMLVAAERQKHEEALAALKHEYAEKLAENEAVHQSVSIAYEKSEKELAEARRHLAEREQADVPVSASSHLLSGAVEHLEKIVDIFAESLAELPADLLDSPAVKNMLAGKRLLCQLMDTLNLFSGEFQKASPQSEELLNICQTWQEEFSRKYPSLDLYFKYPVDGKAVFYDLQVRAILRELVENAAEALADQAGAEVKVKIQIKSPEEMAKGHFKQGISQNCLLVQVVDNCQSMFDPEQVVKHYYTNKDGHIGLGLSICQFLLEKMDGELELRSTPNGGVATFYVPLP